MDQDRRQDIDSWVATLRREGRFPPMSYSAMLVDLHDELRLVEGRLDTAMRFAESDAPWSDGPDALAALRHDVIADPEARAVYYETMAKAARLGIEQRDSHAHWINQSDVEPFDG